MFNTYSVTALLLLLLAPAVPSGAAPVVAPGNCATIAGAGSVGEIIRGQALRTDCAPGQGDSWADVSPIRVRAWVNSFASGGDNVCRAEAAVGGEFETAPYASAETVPGFVTVHGHVSGQLWSVNAEY